ncbi:MAG: TrpB-like pyridoxal-phosphate dependent enzyme, partial [Chloroflexota bacterium]
GGVQNHGRNALLSVLRHAERIECETVSWEQAAAAQKVFADAEGIVPAAESSLAVAEAIRQAQLLEAEAGSGIKTLVFTLTGRDQAAERS